MEKEIKEQPRRSIRDLFSDGLSFFRKLLTRPDDPVRIKPEEPLKANPKNVGFTPDGLKSKLDTIPVDTIPTKEKEISMDKAVPGANVKEDIEMFKTILGKDKNYMDAIDILQAYDKSLSLNPAPERVSATREMFSAILEKAGYKTAAEYLYPELEPKNLNLLLGLDEKAVLTDMIPGELHVPGLDDIEIRKHLIDMAEIEKASTGYMIKNAEELYNTHIEERNLHVTGEGMPESEYQKETERLLHNVDNTRERIDSSILGVDRFIQREKMSVDILQDLKSMNVDIRELKETGMINELVVGNKTSRLVTVPFPVGGVNVDFKARLSIKTDKEGKAHLQVHPKRDLEAELANGFRGHTFSEEEKGNLMAMGNAGKIISVKDENGVFEKFLVGIDSLTNELVAIRQQDVTIKDTFGGIQLTEKKMEELRSGRPIFLEDMKKGNIECSSLVQYNVEKGRLEMLQYGLNISSIQNVRLQKEQQELLKEGKTVLISGLFDGKGVKYNAWVRLDMKNMRLMRSKETPEKTVDIQKEIVPSTDHRVQVSQNTRGVKTEENKFSSTPMLSGNQKPSDNQDQRRNRGHKM